MPSPQSLDFLQHSEHLFALNQYCATLLFYWSLNDYVPIIESTLLFHVLDYDFSDLYIHLENAGFEGDFEVFGEARWCPII